MIFALVAALAFGSPANARERCFAGAEIDWQIDEQSRLIADPGVRVQFSFAGNMVQLELLELKLEEELIGTENFPFQSSILPLSGASGILLVERAFDADNGRATASSFFRSVCRISQETSVTNHGWQITYNNKVLDGAYIADVLKEL